MWIINVNRYKVVQETNRNKEDNPVLYITILYTQDLSQTTPSQGSRWSRIDTPSRNRKSTVYKRVNILLGVSSEIK